MRESLTKIKPSTQNFKYINIYLYMYFYKTPFIKYFLIIPLIIKN
jgi:hypothetical protein